MPSFNKVSQSDSPAVSLADVKAHLRVTHDLDDDLITQYRDTATSKVEQRTDRQLSPATYVLYLDKWYRNIPLPKSPVLNVIYVTYYDEEALAHDFTDSVQQDLKSPVCRLFIDSDVSLPVLYSGPNPIEIHFTAGYELDEYGAPTLPDQLRQAVYFWTGHLWTNREATLTGTIGKEMDLTVDSMVEDYITHNPWYWELR